VVPHGFVSLQLPGTTDLVIQSQWKLDENGKFISKVEGTRGVYISCANADVIEWVDPPQASTTTVADQRRRLPARRVGDVTTRAPHNDRGVKREAPKVQTVSRTEKVYFWRAPRSGGYRPSTSVPEPTVAPRGPAGASSVRSKDK
jgi:hypothetical protein